MNKSPELSVVLPVYNGSKYLADAIESVLDQTFTNFELLMIDDGSTDSSLEIMRDFAGRDVRIALVTRENRGLVSTLNEMISMARGKWIARMDADDISTPNRFERQLVWLETTGADVCGSWVQRFGTTENSLVRLQQSDTAIKTELLFRSPFAHPSIMMRSSLAKALPYDDHWIKAEDYDLWVRAASAGWKMTNLPEVLLQYRMHAEQVSAQSAEFQQQQGQKIRRRYWHQIFESQGLDDSGLDKGLEIFTPATTQIDMQAVDHVFSELLRNSTEESRNIILPQLTRLYILSAADCPGIVSWWTKMNRQFGSGRGIGTRIQLWIFRILRIRENSRMFRWLKTIHMRIAAR